MLVNAVRHSDGDHLTVLEPKPADKPADWRAPSRSSVAAFVYGPAGLNRNKVERFLSKDDELVAQLADYAEMTAQTEALIQALTSDSGSRESTSGEAMNAAFRGFASQYGTAAHIDHSQPADQQMMLALRALNPAVANYDPISPQPSQRAGQTAGLVTSVAALFFGSPVGLAAGGTAMLLEMHSIVFPNTIFRSTLAQILPDDGLGLCGRRDAVPNHTKVAYLWAMRIPNIGSPHVLIPKSVSLPVGMRAPLPIEVPSDTDWKYLDRARKWMLEPAGNAQKSISVPVHRAGDLKALEIDLSKVSVPPGKYHLTASWDWDKFAVRGDVIVAALSGFEGARLLAESQDRLITKAGRVPVTLEGADFEFVAKVELAKPGDKFFTPMPAPFALPQGFRLGVQSHMDIQVNTADLDPGEYRLTITQADGKPHSVPMAIFPAPPKFENLPLMVNRGDVTREITLKGERLYLVAALKSAGATITLAPATSDGAERKATLRLDPGVATGQSFNLQTFLENHSEPITVPNAIRVIGPRPRITDSRLSTPPVVDVSLNPGELPASYFLSAMLRVSDWSANDVLTLQCGDAEDQARLVLRPGVKSSAASLERLSASELFVTFDDSVFPNGCELKAVAGIAQGTGDGAAYALGRIVRIPKIESLRVVEEPAGGGRYKVTMTGQDLQTIDRAGWDRDNGTVVTELPAPIPGEGQKQLLRIPLESKPGADTALYVWLRGETAGRASQVRVQGQLKPGLRATAQPDNR